MIVKVGDIIQIINKVGNPLLNGVCGLVLSVNAIGDVFGTWGSIPITTGKDHYRVISKVDMRDDLFI